MKDLFELNDYITVWGSDSAPTNNVANTTAEKIVRYAKDGFEIYVGNNPYMDKAKKWQGRDLVRIAQTNSRWTGRSNRTIWAVK